jgi:hypothetical protein
VLFEDTKFFVADVGVYIDGISTQVNGWTFDNCMFEEIANQAFVSTNGYGTLFVDTEFTNCGNGQGDAAYPVVEIVSFGETRNNRLVNCKSNRHQAAALTEVASTVGYTEVLNASSAVFIDRNYFDIYLHDSPKPLAALSTDNKYTYVNYTLSLGSHTRVGKLTITVDNDLTNASLTDEYQYSASLVSNPGGSLMTNFNFSVQLLDNNNDTVKDTVLLSYENPTATGALGTISYNVSYGV